MPYHASHITASAGKATERTKRQRRSGLDRLKYSKSIRCASFLVVRVRGTVSL
jgi:hypothetical protein